MSSYYGNNYSPYYLMHYGVKGMRWGVRRQRETSGPRTSWGRNRAYAKEQDARNKSLYRSDKATYKSAKKAYKSGASSKEDFKKAKSTFKTGKKRYRDYNRVTSSYSYNYGMSKAARGKIMQKQKITADTPYTSNSFGKALAINGQAMVKQMAKQYATAAVTTAAVSAGAAYLMNRMNMDTGNAARALTKGSTIYLKPRQYKVQ